jgi:hypothetical protein
MPRHLDLNHIAVAVSGEVVTKHSEDHKQFYVSKLKQFKSEGVKLPEAAALAALVEYAIQRKSYIDYYSHINRADEMLPFGKYDVIVVFNPDPCFGILGDDDGEPVIQYSTSTGIMSKYL